jgi:phosphoglycerate dehydrogenase-like enzyme
MNLLFCGTGWLPMIDKLRERLPAGVSVQGHDRTRPLIDQVANVDIILPSNARIDAPVIEAAKNLRAILQPAVGTEGIDMAAAKARGIPVCNAPGFNSDAVAQLALLLILAVARRWREAERTFREVRIGVPLGNEVNGKVLGIIGMGKAGSKLARVAEALQMEVVGVRSSSSRADLEDLLRRSDFVSIHTPLNATTRGLIGEAELALMKPGAFLVNCSRGGLIQRPALEAALESKHLGGVGLDVFWEEPWNPSDPLFAREDVVVLPHLGGSTLEVFDRVADLTVENVRRLTAGEPLLQRIV